MVSPADSTLVAIRKKIRRLTASASESALSTNDIDQYINTFYNNDFPYAIKLDQMRSVYTFYTRPYIDRYPLDVNYNQGVRDPIYVDGIQGYFFKDRDQFFRMWPRWPTKFTPASGDGVTTLFTFTLPGPFLSKEVVIGTVSTTGAAISIADDGNGNLQIQVPNPVVSVPAQTSPSPGMKNLNTQSPGQNLVTNVGIVNYVTGAMTIDYSLAGVIPGANQEITARVSQYSTGRPYSILFWNNEFTIRPVPKLIHKVELETYLTPVQFLQTSDSPILNQWWQYIAIGAAIKVLEDRQDMDGVANLIPLFDRQEGLVLERQGVEEINQRNTTLYSSTVTSQGWNNGFGQGWY